MGTVVSRKKNVELSDSTAVKIRVVAAFQSNCKDNSRPKEGDVVEEQTSSTATSSSSKTADSSAAASSTKLRASVAKATFPKGVYPQRESKMSLTADNSDNSNELQPYRLNLGLLTSSGTRLCNTTTATNTTSVTESHVPKDDTVVQLQSGKVDHLVGQPVVDDIPDELEWLTQKGLSPQQIHKAATVIQKSVRGYQCKRRLAEKQNSAMMIQKKFRQWRRKSSLMLLRKNTEDLFVIGSSRVADTVDKTSATNDHTNIDDDNKIIENHDENFVTKEDNSDTTTAHTDPTGRLDYTHDTVHSTSSADGHQISTNTDLAAALKEVLSITVPNLPGSKPSGDLENKYSSEDQLEIFGQKTRDQLNKMYRTSLLDQARHYALTIGQEQFRMYLEFQNEIDETMFLAQQKAELCLGDSYVPRKVLLISSRVPKVKLLQSAILPEVITFVYDFENATFLELISKIAAALDEYKSGAKIKQLGMICKGGPGYLYMFANKPITPVKLFKDHKMMTFWRVLGVMMSKLVPEETTIHFMESNVNGNKQGEKLLKDLEKLMYPSKVNIKCPLEISQAGQQMMATYFHPPKFKMWKLKRYTKLKLFD